MAMTVTLHDPAIGNSTPDFERTIPTLSGAQRSVLLKLVALLEKGSVNATNLSSLDLILACIVNSNIDATNATALNVLLAAVKAGTDVSSVVTAINAL